ncbi:MAG TPA: hypothetical protein VES59_02840 [Bacteroidota bacterium]|nr:hypothetical protein [Bacteroidota bacterium]
MHARNHEHLVILLPPVGADSRQDLFDKLFQGRIAMIPLATK